MSFMLHPYAYLSGYQVARSLRGRSTNSNYMNRTPGAAGNQKTWTFSTWVKRSILGTVQCLFSCGTGATIFEIRFESSDAIACYYNSSTAALISSQAFRDVTAWGHLVVACDTNQGTNSNKLRVYWNGTEITAWDTDNRSSLGTGNTNMNQAASMTLFRYSASASEYADVYQADTVHIDGTQLTPSSFAENDATTGQWIPKTISGLTYGTCGFYLKYADNSSTANLGTDSSGNGNTWTVNNFSVTAGVTNDSLTDTPTNYGTDTGAGGEVRGNYCTLSPLYQNNNTMTAGNLGYSIDTGGSYARVMSSLAFSQSEGQKIYFEFKISSLNGGNGTQWGVVQATNTNLLSNTTATVFRLCQTADGKITNRADGGGTPASYGSALAVNDIGMCAVDFAAGKIWYGANGTWFNSGSPSAGTNAAYTDITGGDWYIVFNTPNTGGANAGDVNFGQRTFSYTAPSGFKALCTQNLSDPAIALPNYYFDVKTRTGTGASATQTGLFFQPDLIWTKSRSNATNHNFFDSTRGVQNGIIGNASTAEYADSGTLTAFTSDGYTFGSDGTPRGVNTNAHTYVDFLWKENITAGLDVVGYAGDNTSNRNISHNLGVAPKFALVRSRSTGDFYVWHIGLAGATYFMKLDSTGGPSNASTPWGTGNFSATQFMVTNDATNNLNANATNYIAYLFAEIAGFSKFGTYTGNASTDGPFIFLGFRPKFFMVKRADATAGSWIMEDAARSPYNQNAASLVAETAGAETTGGSAWAWDFLSNGVKIMDSGPQNNASTVSYIYAAFAEAPFKYARAR